MQCVVVMALSLMRNIKVHNKISSRFQAVNNSPRMPEISDGMFPRKIIFQSLQQHSNDECSFQCKEFFSHTK